MKFAKLLLFILIVIALGVSLLAYEFNKPVSDKLLSPLSLASNTTGGILSAQVFTESSNIWQPPEAVVLNSPLPPPQISARSALVVDLTTNQTLYAKDIRSRQPVASLVKIMTAIIALERKNLKDVFAVSERAAAIGEDSMGVSAGEKYTLEQLLYGLLLPSGNDAAEVIAENVAGSTEAFVQLMNEKAKVLGANDTKFINPSGLQEDGWEQYSTVYDLAIISRYAWKNFPVFRRIVGTRFYEIPYSPDHKYLYLENQTNLLTTYPGVKGIKPGYTPEAGLCLVTLAENGGYQILAIIIGSNDRRSEMKQLLDTPLLLWESLCSRIGFLTYFRVQC